MISLTTALCTKTIHSKMLCLVAAYAAASSAATDEVTSLPGWSGALPSKHYSGYLPVRGNTSHVHYYLQLSEGDPAKDPITLWSNGGPGCTSLKGAFEELGQLVFNRDSVSIYDKPSAVPKLFYNPLGWTRISTMLYLEHPTGVGFSYCDACLHNATCKCQATDTTDSEDNYDALIAFFERFPQFKKNDFYITGESYAGIYIPMTMGQIMKRGGIDNLKGAAIGNGCTGTDPNRKYGDRAPYLADLYYGNGLFSKKLYTKLQAGCKGDWKSAACRKLTDQMNAEVGPHNFYNLQDFCPNKDSLDFDRTSGTTTSSASMGLTMSEWLAVLEPRPDGTIPRMDAPLHDEESPAKSAAGASCATVSGSGSSSSSSAPIPLGAEERWCGVDSAMMHWLTLPYTWPRRREQRPTTWSTGRRARAT